MNPNGHPETFESRICLGPDSFLLDGGEDI
jgi:hypothetical protein